MLRHIFCSSFLLQSNCWFSHYLIYNNRTCSFSVFIYKDCGSILVPKLSNFGNYALQFLDNGKVMINWEKIEIVAWFQVLIMDPTKV
jgi:hypothetical protein